MVSGGLTTTYGYDAAANLTTEVRDTGTTTATYDAADHLSGTTGPAGPGQLQPRSRRPPDGRQTAAGEAFAIGGGALMIGTGGFLIVLGAVGLVAGGVLVVVTC